MTLKEALDYNIVTFSFTKVSNKSQRIAIGTRDLNLIPVQFHPKGTGKEKSDNILTFFDWEKKVWRSCLISKLFGSWEIKEKHLLYRIDKYKELGLS